MAKLTPGRRLPGVARRAPKVYLTQRNPITITLHFPHSINNLWYGPAKEGDPPVRVRVKHDLARVLLEQERRALHEVNHFRDQHPAGRIITRNRRGQHRAVLVDPDNFDAYMGQVTPLEVRG